MSATRTTARLNAAWAAVLFALGTTVLPLLHNVRHRDDHSHGPFAHVGSAARLRMHRHGPTTARTDVAGRPHHHGHAAQRGLARPHRHVAEPSHLNHAETARDRATATAHAHNDHESDQGGSEPSRDPLHAAGALAHFGAAVGFGATPAFAVIAPLVCGGVEMPSFPNAPRPSLVEPRSSRGPPLLVA